MGNNEIYEKGAIASNVIQEDSLDASQKKKRDKDPFGREGTIPEPDMTKTFINAEHFLEEYGDKCGVKGDISLARKRIVVDSLDKLQIIATMRGGYYNCITGEKIDVENIQCILGDLEDFFDRTDYGYRYYNGYSAIFFLNKEKWESLQKLVYIS